MRSVPGNHGHSDVLLLACERSIARTTLDLTFGLGLLRVDAESPDRHERDADRLTPTRRAAFSQTVAIRGDSALATLVAVECARSLLHQSTPLSGGQARSVTDRPARQAFRTARAKPEMALSGSTAGELRGPSEIIARRCTSRPMCLRRPSRPTGGFAPGVRESWALLFGNRYPECGRNRLGDMLRLEPALVLPRSKRSKLESGQAQHIPQ